MPYIFRFHKGRNNNIYDWKASDKILPADVREVMDKTNILSSSAGTSIPTPIGRMFLFKTAFEIIAAQVRDNQVNAKSIYAGIVSETLDLLELLYKSGSDENKFRYQNWVFDNSQQDEATILKFFGTQPGHRLLAESFRQAASQAPFNNAIQITLIYYREGGKEILMGGTSPFSFVFTSPNFKRKLQDRGFRAINGLISNDILFDADYKQLEERDQSFIKYIESLANEGSIEALAGFKEYVANTRNRYHDRFNGTMPDLKNIHFADTPLSIGSIALKQVSEQDFRGKINLYSDFKMTLPQDTHYTNPLTPLFLLNEMQYEGVYTSPTSQWSAKTRVNEMEYPETTVEEMMHRDLPGISGFTYPFLSSFDIFERCLVKLPGYSLNDQRFVTLADNQSFLLPIKPLFFHFFPASRLAEYVSIEVKNRRAKNGDLVEVVNVTVTIPIHGTGKGSRKITSRKSYSALQEGEKEEFSPIVQYTGILGIFPLTRTTQTDLLHINKYTVASFERTNATFPIESIKFLKKTGLDTVPTQPILRSRYDDIYTKTTYYQLNESFDIIQLNFRHEYGACGGVIIPKFREVSNGTEKYVYAIDFGTSNTHVEYGRVVNDKVTETYPFTIAENTMQMTLLNKPREVVQNDGALRYADYESNLGDMETARQLTQREFVPFQVGPQRQASVKFPFKTATCESEAFISNQANNRLFADANIGFNIDNDFTLGYVRYQTDLKWLLEHAGNNPFHLNRVSIFFQELLLFIRTKVLLEEANMRGDIFKVQIVMSLPVSMGPTLRNLLIRLMDVQRVEIFSAKSLPLKQVTESIAPYYQLRYINHNIQNDSSCNIDIGGGTTDIVLINRSSKNYNELNCYCSSFKFAGRQLWGSGHNDFNADSNGFIAYYKTFIEKADKTIANRLQPILNNRTQRTEDLVAVLFSKPEYRFTDIFSENKELRAVLIIHYSAILYYVTRLARLQNTDLPRTVSFSGKGSEYLSIILPSDNALRGFTYKALAAFSGTTIRNDFMVERSIEPKVITAKGSAHFATEKVAQQDDSWDIGGNEDEKRLVLTEVNYKGFNNLTLEPRNITYKDLMENEELFGEVMKSVDEFFHLLFDNDDLCTLLNRNLEFRDFARYKNFFLPAGIDITREGRLRDSFKATVANAQPNDKVSDSPFFFALNYSLTEFSKYIFDATPNP